MVMTWPERCPGQCRPEYVGVAQTFMNNGSLHRTSETSTRAYTHAIAHIIRWWTHCRHRRGPWGKKTGYTQNHPGVLSRASCRVWASIRCILSTHHCRCRHHFWSRCCHRHTPPQIVHTAGHKRNHPEDSQAGKQSRLDRRKARQHMTHYHCIHRYWSYYCRRCIPYRWGQNWERNLPHQACSPECKQSRRDKNTESPSKLHCRCRYPLRCYCFHRCKPCPRARN